MNKMATKRAFFTDDQKAILAKSYDNSPYPTSAQREALATLMKKPTKQIGNWFKNERARQIKKQNRPSRPTRNLAIKKRREQEYSRVQQVYNFGENHQERTDRFDKYSVSSIGFFRNVIT